MNWILAVLGVPAGMLLFEIGYRLTEKLKPKESVKGLLLALPFAIFCLAIMLIDIFYETYFLDMAVGLFAFSVTGTIFIIVLGRV